jgi:hypothetical protein
MGMLPRSWFLGSSMFPPKNLTLKDGVCMYPLKDGVCMYALKDDVYTMYVCMLSKTMYVCIYVCF